MVARSGHWTPSISGREFWKDFYEGLDEGLILLILSKSFPKDRTSGYVSDIGHTVCPAATLRKHPLPQRPTRSRSDSIGCWMIDKIGRTDRLSESYSGACDGSFANRNPKGNQHESDDPPTHR